MPSWTDISLVLIPSIESNIATETSDAIKIFQDNVNLYKKVLTEPQKPLHNKLPIFDNDCVKVMAAKIAIGLVEPYELQWGLVNTSFDKVPHRNENPYGRCFKIILREKSVHDNDIFMQLYKHESDYNL